MADFDGIRASLQACLAMACAQVKIISDRKSTAVAETIIFYVPMPRTNKHQTAVALLDLGMRNVCPKMRALSFHSVELLGYLSTLFCRQLIFGRISLIRDNSFRRSESKENK